MKLHNRLYATQRVIDTINRDTSDDEYTPLSQKKSKSKKSPKKASKVVTSSDSEEFIPSEEEYTPAKTKRRGWVEKKLPKPFA